MILHVFAVYDEKAAAFLPPFFLPTKGTALRAFADAVNDRNHLFAKHPADYTLFHLAEFDDGKGSFNVFPTPQSLGLALEFVNK